VTRWTDSNHDLPIADRIFETENADAVMAPNQVWTDKIEFIIESIKINMDNFLYLETELTKANKKILDIESRLWFLENPRTIKEGSNE
jgi:hypothetical protein